VLRADDASVVAGRARTRVADTDIIASRGIGGTRGRLLGRRGGDAKRTTRVSERHGDIESDDSAAGSGLRATRGTLSPSVVARSRILRKSRKDSVPKCGSAMRGNAGETPSRALRAMRVGDAPRRVRKCRERFANGSESCRAVRRRGGECVDNA
jgi:hypothetical protein